MSELYRGRRVLVTGGVGFIGSNLAIRLCELGADVLLVDSMLPAYGASMANVEPVRDRLCINFSDIRDPHSMDYLVRGQELIFSLAGQVSHVDSMRDPMTDLEINCRAQLALLECCRRCNPTVRMVFASTRQLYGRPLYLPVDERHPLVPVDVNGINNLAAEMYYKLYHDVHGMPTVSLRLTNTYGPRMDLASDSKGFLGVFVRRALRGETIHVYGTGRQLRDFNYVDDVVEALLLAGESERVRGGAFNLGHPQTHSVLEVAELLGAMTGAPHDVVPFPAEIEAIDIGDYYGDFARFREATGWIPTVGLDEGLQRTLEYFREHA